MEESIKYKAYDHYNEEMKNHVDTICPFKIDDKVKVERFYGTKHFSHSGIISDIGIVPMINTFSLDTYQLINSGILNVDEKELYKPSNQFRLEYTYTELKPNFKKKWWEFWKKMTYTEVEETDYVMVDQWGIASSMCGTIFINKL